MLPLGRRRGGPGRTGLLLSPIRSAMTQAPAPLRRGGNLARFTMGFSPAAPGDQERASQAMRLLPQPRPSGTRCGWGGARWGGGGDALSPAASTGCVCFLQISCSSAEAPSPPTALPRLCCGGPESQGQGGSAPLVPEGLPSPPATQDGTGRGRGRGTRSSAPGLSSSVMDLSGRKHIPSTICWPGAELPREG